MWRLINNNTEIISISHTHHCKPTVAPPCIYDGGTLDGRLEKGETDWEVS